MNVIYSRSKNKSISNICALNDIKVLVCSETHTSGSQVPRISKTMVPFHRNRSDAACKGGIAIYLHESLKNSAVIIDKGEEDNEWIAVKVNKYCPPLIVVAVYGQQENIKRELVRDKWKNIFEVADRFKHEGNQVVLAGDFNIAVGKELGMENNDESVSNGGRQVIDLINNGGWFVANKLMEGSQKTHVDRSGGKERTLDYLVTSNEEMVVKAVCDDEFRATPYQVLMKGKTVIGRKFTDHKSIMMKIRVKKKKIMKEGKPETRFIKTDESIAEFKVITDNIAKKMLPDVIQKKTPIPTIMKRMKREVRRANYKAHKPMKPSKKKEKILKDEEIFFYHTDKLEKEMENLDQMKTNNKIWTARRDQIVGERNQECFAMYNKDGTL